MAARRSYVVTGGGRGIGRVIVETLFSESSENVVIALDLEPKTLGWLEEHPSRERVIPISGNASNEDVAEEAADVAESFGPIVGWVNNAAIFRDAKLHLDGPSEVMEAIALNLKPAVVGCSTAVRRFLNAGTGGAIVNVSSHQAQRAVRGAMPYATAKAALEGLTRALAVDYGSLGIRVNAVALGSIHTERYARHLSRQKPEEAARIENEMRLLHPAGRVGRAEEVASAVTYLLSDSASFINGAILPVDGGRSALGRDPEETDTSTQR